MKLTYLLLPALVACTPIPEKTETKKEEKVKEVIEKKIESVGLMYNYKEEPKNNYRTERKFYWDLPSSNHEINFTEKRGIIEENKNPEYVIDTTFLTIDKKDYWVKFEEIEDGNTHKISMAYYDKEIYFYVNKNYKLQHYTYKGENYRKESNNPQVISWIKGYQPLIDKTLEAILKHKMENMF